MKSGQWKKLRRPFIFVEGTIDTVGFAYDKGGRVYEGTLYAPTAPLREGTPVVQSAGLDYTVHAKSAADEIVIGTVNSTIGDFEVMEDGKRKGAIVLNGVINTGVVDGTPISAGFLVDYTIPGGNSTPEGEKTHVVGGAPTNTLGYIPKIALTSGQPGEEIDFIELGGL